jgi:hypothetical protein
MNYKKETKVFTKGSRKDKIEKKELKKNGRIYNMVGVYRRYKTAE